MSKITITVVIVALVAVASAYAFFDWRRDKARTLENGVVAFKSGNFDQAVKLLEPLAEKGNATAQDLLGLAYAHGHGVPKNREYAQQLLIAAHGVHAMESFYHIALRFDKGENTAKDTQEALAWYNIAAEHGHKVSQRLLAQAYREGRYGLTPNQSKAEHWSKLAEQ